MPYYHIFILYIDENKQLKPYMSFGYTEELLRENVIVPYMENKIFMFSGRVFYPSNVKEIHIFESDESQGKKLILPNGKPAIDETNTTYLLKSFREAKVKGVNNVTPSFITSPPKEELLEVMTRQIVEKKKVFIAHGRDEKQPLLLQKFLKDKLKVDAEVFGDYKEKSGSDTIIEQLEYIKDNVGYAFVIVTPDDLGCLRENIDKCRTTMLVGKRNVTVKSVCDILDNLHTRARQNVVFEHGLFIGALGRDRVCCLLQKDVKERPSDIDGILYEGFKKSVKETFTEITQKLKKAGLIKT